MKVQAGAGDTTIQDLGPPAGPASAPAQQHLARASLVHRREAGLEGIDREGSAIVFRFRPGGVDPAREDGVADIGRHMRAGSLTDLTPGGFGIVLGIVILFFAIAVAWSIVGHVDIIATASGNGRPVARLGVGAALNTLGNITGAMVFQGTIPVSIGLLGTDWMLAPTALITMVLAVAAATLGTGIDLAAAQEKPKRGGTLTIGRNHDAVLSLVQLADLLSIPVIDLGARLNFPNTHALNLTGRNQQLIADADVILGLDVMDLYGALVKQDPATHASVPATGNRIRIVKRCDILCRQR